MPRHEFMIKYLKYFQCIILIQVFLCSFLLSQLVKNLDKFIHTSKTGDLDTGYPNALATYKTEFYEDGTKYSEGYYENGLMNGSWTYYYTNAAIKAKGKYPDPMIHRSRSQIHYPEQIQIQIGLLIISSKMR